MNQSNGRRVYTVDVCAHGHDLLGANGLVVHTEVSATTPGAHINYRMCRTCRGVGQRSYGAEWSNHRNQVFVFVPDHPHSRKDGFYARSKLAVEEAQGALLPPESRVYHEDGDPANDKVENLTVFANQKALAEYRSQKLKAARKRTGWESMTPEERDGMRSAE